MQFSFNSTTKLLENLQNSGINEEILLQLIQHIKSITLKPNQLLLKAGQINTHLYYVLAGGFVCRFVSGDGEVKRTINFYLNELHPVMACIDSYFSQTKTQCELKAIAKSTVLAIPKTELDKILNLDDKFKTLYDNLLTRALIEENDLKLKIISSKPDELYQYILREFAVVVQKVPSKYIAELMGISAEWLSKLKSKQRFIS
ncbi:Crp/Fnr family transcriptional regulator [Emticicia sp. 17c]|uniref:Crp/Fnr family transcriptional regulator n=1 Tax=Emticicia sp. 17c TaxID=3127704 RepID=UPI00301CD890